MAYFHRTYFEDNKHFDTASNLLRSLMTYKVERNDLWEGGKVPLEGVYTYLSQQCDFLDYLDFEHLVELDLKQTENCFELKGDYLIPTQPRTVGKQITAPDTLYFGTIRKLATSILSRGLTSRTQEYVLVTSSKEIAAKRALQFCNNSLGISDEKEKTPVIIVIDSHLAQEEGIVFLGGKKESLFQTAYLSSKYLTCEDVAGGY